VGGGYILRLVVFFAHPHTHTHTHTHTALSVALLCGLGLTLFYVVGTPSLLAALRVEPALRPAAASYIYWRGAIAWAALAQSVCLSILMATRDAVTPLKIIGLAAGLNVVADALLCAWPFRWGCSGAAAATSLATLVSCGFMIRALAKKQLLPQVRLPTRPELWALLTYTGPLIAIPITRLAGFIVMQKKAMQLGVESLAGYQLGINILMFFLLFGEPLSQLSQTNLPALLDQENATAVKSTLKGALTLAVFTSIGVAVAAFSTARFGVGLFTSDVGVQMVTQGASLSLLIAVATSVFTVAVDGAMFAARDFGFMLAFGLGTFLCQLALFWQPLHFVSVATRWRPWEEWLWGMERLGNLCVAKSNESREAVTNVNDQGLCVKANAISFARVRFILFPKTKKQQKKQSPPVSNRPNQREREWMQSNDKSPPRTKYCLDFVIVSFTVAL
jgi:Na+-driven multidrug efflux pump